MLSTLLFSLLGIGIILFLFQLANIVYRCMLIPIEKVDAGTSQKHSLCSPVQEVTSSIQKTNVISMAKKIAGYRAVPATIDNYTISPFASFYHNGKRVNPKKYIISIVDGNCMAPRNIYTGDLLFIEKFNGNLDALSIGDILYIQREDSESSKIREYRGKDADDSERVKTLLYKEDGVPEYSVPSHKISNIKGVVRIRFAAN
jgi:hypothetical protein